MSSPPQDVIRRYLDEQGGEVQVPAHNLLTSWRLNDFGPGDRERIASALAEAGITTQPELREAERDTVITLVVEARPAEEPARADPPRAERRHAKRWLLPVAALVAAALASGGIWLLVGSLGDDDADNVEAFMQRRANAIAEDANAISKQEDSDITADVEECSDVSAAEYRCEVVVSDHGEEIETRYVRVPVDEDTGKPTGRYRFER